MRDRIQSQHAVFALFVLAASAATAVEFETHELGLEAAPHQTVLTGDLLPGDSLEIAIVQVDKRGLHELIVFAWGASGWAPARRMGIPASTLFVDVARVGRRERVIAYEAGRVRSFDAEAGTSRVLFEVATPYRATRADGIPLLDVTRDLNGDGLDDVVIPHPDGFWVAIQDEDGSFRDAESFGPPEPFLNRTAVGDKRPYGAAGMTPQNIPWYLSRIHQFDYDGDGREDLVFWNEDHLDVHLQDETGGFAIDPQPVATEVAFDGDGTYSLIFAFEDESMFRLLAGFRKTSEYTILHSFRDLDGDGVEDLLTQTITGRSALRQRNRFEVHYGAVTADGLKFDPKPGALVRAEGDNGQPIGYSEIYFQDLDGDGQEDITFGRVRTGFPGMLRAMLASSVALDVDFYVRGTGALPQTPSYSLSIRPRLAFFKKGVLFPVVLVGDVDGDGRPDLLVGQTFDEMLLRRGVAGPGLFDDDPVSVTARAARDERNMRLEDLDGDGRDDLFIHHPTSTDGAGRIVTLMARSGS